MLLTNKKTRSIFGGFVTLVFFLIIIPSFKIKLNACSGGGSNNYETYDCSTYANGVDYCEASHFTAHASCGPLWGYCAYCIENGQNCTSNGNGCNISGAGDGSGCGPGGIFSTGGCCTAVDGGWSDWSSCDASCGGGTRTRSCNNPAPSCGGADCVGKSSDDCNTQPCCTCTAPTEAPILNSPNQTFSNYNGSLTLTANSISSGAWGEECSNTGRSYSMCWGTNAADPCVSGNQTTSLSLPTNSVTLNTLGTYYWKYWAVNGCGIAGPNSAIGIVINSAMAKTCSLSTGSGLSLVGNVYVGVTNTPFDITLSGNANSSTQDRIRMIFEKTNYTVIPSYQTDITPITSQWTDGTTYNYQFTGSSLATTSNNVSGTTNINIGRSGNYYIHCDLPTDPSKCSGNPGCIVNGGGSACSGWPSCSGPANARGGDNLELCITNENCTKLCGQSRGCGLADCASTAAGIPDKVVLVSPNGTIGNPTNFAVATNSIILTMRSNSSLTDRYNYEVWPSTGSLKKVTDVVDGNGTVSVTIDVSTWDKTDTYRWRANAMNSDCAVEIGEWSDYGYFKFNSPPEFPSITPPPSPPPTWPPRSTPTPPISTPTPTTTSSITPTVTPPGFPTDTPTPTTVNVPTNTPIPTAPPTTPIPTVTPPGPTPPEIIGNNGPQLPDVFGRNHTCEVDSNQDRVFAHPSDPGTYVGGRVKFSVEVKDADGADDIASVQLRFNSQTHSMQLQSPVPLGTQISATLTLDFDSGDLTTSALPIELKADDKSGASTGWITTARLLKVWDCNVPLSGTMYDSTNEPNGAVCLTGTGFQIPASAMMNFMSVDLAQIRPPTSSSLSVVNPPGNVYPSTSATVFWGREYRITPNANLLATGVINRWIDMGNGYTPINCNVQEQVINTVVDPYTNSPKLSVDFSGIVNQEPWYQVKGGGVFSRSASVVGMVPITCYNDTSYPKCQSSITTDSISLGSQNNGLVAAPSVSNNTGCSLVLGTCKAGDPNNWWYETNVVNDNYNYQYFYDNYYVKQGLGTVFTGPKTLSQILAALPPGNQQIVFVNGNLTIDNDNQVGNGDFLMVIVSGNITISQSVNLTEGIFVSGGVITAEANTTTTIPLVINGMLYTSSGSNNDIKFVRGFVDKVQNDLNPSVVVNYQPRFLFSMPLGISKVITDWRIVK